MLKILDKNGKVKFVLDDTATEPLPIKDDEQVEDETKPKETTKEEPINEG